MKIYISKKESNLKCNIIIGRGANDFITHVDKPGEKEFIDNRIKNTKEISVLTGSEKLTVFFFLKEEKKRVYDDLERLRRGAYAIHSILKDHDIKEAGITAGNITGEEMLAFAEGLYLANYRFGKYFTEANDSYALEGIEIVSHQLTEEKVNQTVSALEGTCLARDLVNEPLSYLTAMKLAEEISADGKASGYSVEVFDKRKIESLRMGGLLAVNKGSIDPPTFSILEWKPENRINKKPVVLVGKGIVYDTGGLSLKPTHDSMDYMKCDMGGAASVAGTFHAIAKSKLPIHVIGLIPATDNRPDGNAYVPGDVITMYNGKTVEVLNTDAEGRMILADALSYASQYNPELVIELSTLTGSAHAAVGNYAIVGMGNAESKTMEQLKSSGLKTHERIAEFPFWEDFAELLKSDIADMKNIGGRYAGAITAGKFLEKFTDYPYIHLDIAGPSYNKSNDNYRGTGGSGVGVRLLFDFLLNKTIR